MKTLAFLSLALLVPVLSAASAEAGQEPQKPPVGCVTSLSQSPAFYRALYSLPETRAVIVGTLGQELDRIGPSNLPGSLSAERRQQVLDAIAARVADMPKEEQQAFCKRLDNWLIVDNMLLACAWLGVSSEASVAAELAVPFSRDLYDPIVRNRGFPPDVSPVMVAEDMSGHQEGVEISFELRNRLSLLKTRERVRYFRDLLEQMDKLLPEFGVK